MQLGKYVLERELGKGAMGSVWLSHHPGLGIPVAVKILDSALAARDPDFFNRFIREGTLAATINHQNIVRVYDAGNQDQTYYLVMEYIEGTDARQQIDKEGALPEDQVIDLAISAAEALKTAHSMGIVHRDIKPDNIMVTTNGQIKLADLGIAKQMDDNSATMTGVAMGTPFSELVEMCGGMKDGYKLKAVIPGGSSSPVIPVEQMMVKPIMMANAGNPNAVFVTWAMDWPRSLKLTNSAV